MTGPGSSGGSIFAIFWVIGRWAVRRAVQREMLPRKRRLEALLKELDG